MKKENEPKPSIQVYCPELQAMIRPGEWTDCPFFGGTKLDLSDKEDALRQIFRCHVQCGCKIEYQYYEGGCLVTKVEDSIEDQENLSRVLSLVIQSSEQNEQRNPKYVLLVYEDPDC